MNLSDLIAAVCLLRGVEEVKDALAVELAETVLEVMNERLPPKKL